MSAARTLVVWCPDWPAVAAGAGPETPAAVVAAGRVVACTAAAREYGVRRGHRLRDAQRRCPGLAVYAADPPGEARCFEQVAAVVEASCPRVEVVRPGLCAVPARGPARYYGGEQALAALVRDAVAARGFACSVGIADGVFAAVLAAREGVVVPEGETPRFLASRPLSDLGAVQAVPETFALVGLLSRLGIRTLGAFAALPPGDVLTRFGVDGATAHRLASGREPRAAATRAPAEDLAAVLTLDPPVEQSEPMVFAGKRLADEMHANLAARGLGCERVDVEVTTEDGRSRSRLWRHAGLLSSSAVAERVRWQIDAWRIAEPGSPEALVGGIVRLRLAPDQLVQGTGRQLALWGSGVADDRIDRAASRLQAMLGYQAVTTPVLAGGRGPAEQVLRVPWGDQLEPRLPADGPWPGRVPDPSPAVVHSPPLPAAVTDADGRPVTVSGRCEVSSAPAALTVSGSPALAVTGWTGPWPAVEHWWDAELAHRHARFQLVTDDGRAWLLAVERGQWRVEGSYD